MEYEPNQMQELIERLMLEYGVCEEDAIQACISTGARGKEQAVECLKKVRNPLGVTRLHTQVRSGKYQMMTGSVCSKLGSSFVLKVLQYANL